MAPLFSLNDKVALVTGAGRNAGAAIARLFARQGAIVVVNDAAEDRAREQVEAIHREGGRAFVQAFDVTNLEAVRHGLNAASATAGKSVDILVNNAGNGGTGGLLKMMPFSEMPPELWQVPINVNLFGVMNCTHSVLQPMIKNGWGRIITIASTAGTQGIDGGMSHYAAGKGGAISFMRHVAMENAKHGVTANTIALGLIREGDDPKLNELAKTLPTGRRGTPDDLAPLCLYMASPEAGWFTGQTVELNGGAYTT